MNLPGQDMDLIIYFIKLLDTDISYSQTEACSALSKIAEGYRIEWHKLLIYALLNDLNYNIE
jgi:hypothetical protein